MAESGRMVLGEKKLGSITITFAEDGEWLLSAFRLLLHLGMQFSPDCWSFLGCGGICFFVDPLTFARMEFASLYFGDNLILEIRSTSLEIL